jgi:hypothetical protein
MKTDKGKLVDKSSTIFLKLILYALSIGAIAVASFLIYHTIKTDFVGGYKPILIGVSISMLPFLFIFYQSYLLLNLIDNNQSLTDHSVSALKTVKRTSLLISLMYLVGSPYTFIVAEKDDAPGVVVLNLLLIIGPFTVGVFASILQKLLINAIEYKSETELTI